MVVAALVYEMGICRDDPERLLAMPIQRILFWYDLAVGWRKVQTDSQQKQRADVERRARFSMSR
jgi:hypothetical protein